MQPFMSNCGSNLWQRQAGNKRAKIRDDLAEMQTIFASELANMRHQQMQAQLRSKTRVLRMMRTTPVTELNICGLENGLRRLFMCFE
jgi:hypothetical protein